MIGKRGTVYLVGAGPGDPGLMTVRGMKLLSGADVVVHDRLVSREIIACARSDAEIIDAGKGRGIHRADQDRINRVLTGFARCGLRVVRLKGGDPFVFGRGFEELSACRKAGVDCVVVPGVTSAVAVPAAAGIPVTLRGVARSFAVVTAETAAGLSKSDPDYVALSGIDTLVVMMGRGKLGIITDGLLAAGRDPDTPVACISHGTTPRQRVIRATLRTIVEAVEGADLRAPMITVIGEVIGAARRALDRLVQDVMESTSP